MKNKRLTSFDSLLESFESSFDFPFLKLLCADLIDPYNCSDVKSLRNCLENNISKIQKKIDAIYKIHKKDKSEWEAFIADSSNFSESQWQKLSKIKKILADYGPLKNQLSNSNGFCKAIKIPRKGNRKRRLFWINRG